MKVTADKKWRNPSLVVENNYYYGFPGCNNARTRLLHQRSHSLGFERGMFFIKVIASSWRQV